MKAVLFFIMINILGASSGWAYSNDIVKVNAIKTRVGVNSRFFSPIRGSYANMVVRSDLKSGRLQYFTTATLATKGCGKDVSDTLYVPIGEACASIHLHQGTETLGQSNLPVMVLSRYKINDVFDPENPTKLDPDRMFSRLTVQYSEKDKRYYGVAFVSAGYSKDGKVFPALIMTKAGSNGNLASDWIYVGRFGGEVGSLYGNRRSWTAGMAFIVNDDHDATVNHLDPMRNKFIHYNDFGGLKLTYSADGKNWFLYRNAKTKAIVDVRPNILKQEAFIFTSVAKTPQGYFMYKTGRWPSMKHRLLYSADGINWKVIGAGAPSQVLANEETVVAGIKKPKNINLSYDPVTNRVYLLITYNATTNGNYKLLSFFTPKKY